MFKIHPEVSFVPNRILMKFVISKKFKPLIIYEGFKFCFHKTLKNYPRLPGVSAAFVHQRHRAVWRQPRIVAPAERAEIRVGFIHQPALETIKTVLLLYLH